MRRNGDLLRLQCASPAPPALLRFKRRFGTGGTQMINPAHLDRLALSRAQFLKASGAALFAASLPSQARAADTTALMSRAIPKSKTNEQIPIIGLGTARVFGDRGDATAMAEK